MERQTTSIQMNKSIPDFHKAHVTHIIPTISIYLRHQSLEPHSLWATCNVTVHYSGHCQRANQYVTALSHRLAVPRYFHFPKLPIEGQFGSKLGPVMLNSWRWQVQSIPEPGEEKEIQNNEYLSSQHKSMILKTAWKISFTGHTLDHREECHSTKLGFWVAKSKGVPLFKSLSSFRCTTT